MDHSIGVYVIDRFTYYTLEFLETVNQNSKKTIYELVNKHVTFLILLNVTYSNYLYFKVQLLSKAPLHIDCGL
jgi:glycosylphosphatidylinositol transamidase (GPIT) subunit GPI8